MFVNVLQSFQLWCCSAPATLTPVSTKLRYCGRNLDGSNDYFDCLLGSFVCGDEASPGSLRYCSCRCTFYVAVRAMGWPTRAQQRLRRCRSGRRSGPCTPSRASSARVETARGSSLSHTARLPYRFVSVRADSWFRGDVVWEMDSRKWILLWFLLHVLTSKFVLFTPKTQCLP